MSFYKMHLVSQWIQLSLQLGNLEIECWAEFLAALSLRPVEITAFRVCIGSLVSGYVKKMNFRDLTWSFLFFTSISLQKPTLHFLNYFCSSRNLTIAMTRIPLLHFLSVSLLIMFIIESNLIFCFITECHRQPAVYPLMIMGFSLPLAVKAGN